MSPRTAGANAKRSAVRARIEHVFARQKEQMGLFIRTIGIACAEIKAGLANLVYDIDRRIFPRTTRRHGIAAPGEQVSVMPPKNGLISPPMAPAAAPSCHYQRPDTR
ncbi:hypothetical protein [Sphingomonas sp. UBA978]|uniref:hypothetical protein n=1 Tax=Sphingomonas sp. UBA978 TaxID=1947536 RepID=UPI0025E5F8D4|nr:hypothetical protein [Sphingomonas sp. UBA978]